MIGASFYVKGQGCENEKDNLLYAAAYDYILKDSISQSINITPSHTLTGTSYFWFSDLVDGFKNVEIKTLTAEDYARIPPQLSLSEKEKKELALSLKFQEYDKSSISENCALSCLALEPSVRSDSDLIYTLNFTKVIDNEFFAELNLPATHMGWRYLFLFIFNPDGTIMQVHKKEIHGL